MDIRTSLLATCGALLAAGLMAAQDQPLSSAPPAPILEATDSQAWDAGRLARGWARMDPTGSCAFLDEKNRQLICWMRDAGALERIDLSKLEFKPQFWVVDDSRIWLAAGQRLVLMDLKGNVQRSVNLPGDVGDMDKLPDGVVLSYRTLEPYIEKRDIKTGHVIWDQGQKPRKGTEASRTLHRLICNEDRYVMVLRADKLNFTLLDGAKGKVLGQILFTHQDRLPAPLRDQGKTQGLVWNWGHNTAYYAVPASFLPTGTLEQQGYAPSDPRMLVLVELEVPSSRIRFLPTPWMDDIQLIGVHEGQAIFTSPQGGLVFSSIK